MNVPSAPPSDLRGRSEGRRWLSTRPDIHSAMADYARLAQVYDHETRWIDVVRQAAIDRLEAQPGEIVADIACGTGFCLPALSRAVGHEGKVIGIEPSDIMRAHARSKSAGLLNVELIGSPAQTARLPVAPDALLFSFAHDVLQSRTALKNLLSQAKIGARVVAVGAKLFPWWLAPRNFWFLAGERGYITTYRGLSRPWRLLAGYLDEFAVRPLAPGNKYIVTGRIPSPPIFAEKTIEHSFAANRQGHA